jgi:predicted nucleic acid-binding protein
VSDILKGRYAMVMVTEQGDNKVITAFERVADYMEYLEVQRMEMERVEESMAERFSFNMDKGELN